MTENKISDPYKQSLGHIYDIARGIEGRMQSTYYNDGRHVPTIGIGYAAVVLGRDGRWVIKPTLEADMRAAKIPLGDSQKKTLRAIADELNKGENADTKRLDGMISALRGPELNPEQTKALFAQSYARFYDQTRNIIGDPLFAALSPKRQGILTLVTYQSPASVRRERDALQKALRAGDMKDVGRILIRIGRYLHDESRGLSFAKHFMNTNEKGTVTVNNGDTLGAISARYHVPLRAVMAANPDIANADKIRAGDLICLPRAAYRQKPGDLWADAPAAPSAQGPAQNPSDAPGAASKAQVGATKDAGKDGLSGNPAPDNRPVHKSGKGAPTDQGNAPKQAVPGQSGDGAGTAPHAQNAPSQDAPTAQNKVTAKDKAAPQNKPAGNGETKEKDAAPGTAGKVPAPAKTPGPDLSQNAIDRLSHLYGDRARASRVLRGTIPEQVRNKDFFTHANDGVAALKAILAPKILAPKKSPLPMSTAPKNTAPGNRKAAAKGGFSPIPTRSPFPSASPVPSSPSSSASSSSPTSARAAVPSSKTAEIAGLLLDKAMAERVMTSKAYASASHPLHAFAANAVRNFFKAAYADNTPNAPQRTTIAQEPGRARAIAWIEHQRATPPAGTRADRLVKIAAHRKTTGKWPR
ncbi:LysM peptidoglycan-binding domain-containing protein [Varunaivibrio sulfuroxidans]|nr:LysM peptidoglycan-binding domain-containing protein [Varunaivibrio sulfuroxidans]WES31582.1 LysM peptidoglycan-binding domain-containing protein [Varunaivibrio sulfuroxidans]